MLNAQYNKYQNSLIVLQTSENPFKTFFFVKSLAICFFSVSLRYDTNEQRRDHTELNDDTNEVSMITVDDWWNASTDSAEHVGKNEAFWGLDRICIDNDQPQGTVAVRILELKVQTTSGKNVKSVTFSPMFKGYMTVLGFSNGEPIEVVDGFNADMVAENLPVADYTSSIPLDANTYVLYTKDVQLKKVA